MLVHDDSARVNWKLAGIESVNKGGDGLIRSANIRMATRRTNRPIARLYPLEVTAATEVITKPTAKETLETQTDDHPAPLRRPVREAARRRKERIEEWVTSLCAPWKMSWIVTDCNCLVVLNFMLLWFLVRMLTCTFSEIE